MKLLIVDDDIPTVEVIKTMIHWEALGIDSVEAAYNVAGAEQIILEQHPDIVVSDIEMPKGSGIDLIKWIRRNEFDIQFIFLTCHENFEFASTAIEFEAVAYVTKPLNMLKLQAAVAKAADNIEHRKKLAEATQYGAYWIENRPVLEEDFWKNILSGGIPARRESILSEIRKRHLPEDLLDRRYRLVLTSVVQSQMDESVWDAGAFRYALRNLSSELLLGQIDYSRNFCSDRNGCFCNIVVTRGEDDDTLREKCDRLTELCRRHLGCVMSCYIGRPADPAHLMEAEARLERMDVDNIVSRGKTISEAEGAKKFSSGERYVFDTGAYKALLSGRNKLRLLNRLNRELDALSKENRLDFETLHSIRQDFLQTIDAELCNHGIQAHRLFEDGVFQKLLKNSENSVLDMMRWATFATNRTMDCIQEVEQSESIIEKVKRYIQKNYRFDIRREDIASSVFLTPDYLSKIFKAKTGLNISDYINEYRVEQAKSLLRNTDRCISDIAGETGFDSLSYFSTVFKKTTGQSPSTFKRQCTQQLG